MRVGTRALAIAMLLASICLGSHAKAQDLRMTIRAVVQGQDPISGERAISASTEAVIYNDRSYRVTLLPIMVDASMIRLQVKVFDATKAASEAPLSNSTMIANVGQTASFTYGQRGSQNYLQLDITPR